MSEEARAAAEGAFRMARRGRLGVLGLAGLSLPRLLQAEPARRGAIRARAQSCILFFMEGGPAHQDLSLARS